MKTVLFCKRNLVFPFSSLFNLQNGANLNVRIKYIYIIRMIKSSLSYTSSQTLYDYVTEKAPIYWPKIRF